MDTIYVEYQCRNCKGCYVKTIEFVGIGGRDAEIYPDVPSYVHREFLYHSCYQNNPLIKNHPNFKDIQIAGYMYPVRHWDQKEEDRRNEAFLEEMRSFQQRKAKRDGEE